MKVLLLDDDEVCVITLRAQMEKLGYEVMVARNVTHGLELWKKHQIPIIVCDWIMPGVDGLAFCRAVRAQNTRHTTYFILFSICTTDDENLPIALKSGVDDFISKTADSQEIKIRLKLATHFLEYGRAVEDLEALLPVCVRCGNVRHDNAYLEKVKEYQQRHPYTQQGAALCPDCANKKF